MRLTFANDEHPKSKERTDLVRSLLSCSLRDFKFSKHGSRFSKQQNSVEKCIQVDSSRYANWIKISLCVTALLEPKTSSKPDRMFDIGVSGTFVLSKKDIFVWNNLLDADVEIPESIRRERIKQFLTSYFLPWLDQFDSVDSIRQYLIKDLGALDTYIARPNWAYARHGLQRPKISPPDRT